jgi:hypothetical protein
MNRTGFLNETHRPIVCDGGKVLRSTRSLKTPSPPLTVFRSRRISVRLGQLGLLGQSRSGREPKIGFERLTRLPVIRHGSESRPDP